MSLFEMEPEHYYDSPDVSKKQVHLEQMVMSNNYVFSEKIDGNWCRFVIDEGKIKMQTRNVSKKTGTYGEVQDKVPHIFNELSVFNGRTLILGELYVVGGDDKDVGSILRCLTPKAIARQNVDEKMKLHYRIFDVLYYEDTSLMDATFETRLQYINKLRQKFAGSQYIEVSTFLPMNQLYDTLVEILDRGGEGIVIQSLAGRPEPGKRPAWKSLKIKRELENYIDVVCIGFQKPTREYTGNSLESWPYWENIKSGQRVATNKFNEFTLGEAWEPVTKNYYFDWIGSIICGAYDLTSNLVPICSVSGLTDSLKEEIKQNPASFINEPLVITGMTTTEDKSIRHPRFGHFRNDIDVKDCTMEKIFG